MSGPKEYSKKKDIFRLAAIDALKFFKDALNLQYDDKIAHVGCEDGELTKEISHFHVNNFDTFTGLDADEEKIKVALAQYGDTLIFGVKNFEEEPEEFSKYFNKFHQVFSFFYLDQVKNQKFAFINILDILKPGGNCLFTFLIKSDLYDACQHLVQENHEWKQYEDDFESCFSYYLKIKDPLLAVCDAVNEFVTGKTLNVKDTVEEFEEEAFRDFVCEVCSFIKNLPSDLQKKFQDEMVNEFKDRELVKDDKFQLHLSFLTVMVLKTPDAMYRM